MATDFFLVALGALHWPLITKAAKAKQFVAGATLGPPFVLRLLLLANFTLGHDDLLTY